MTITNSNAIAKAAAVVAGLGLVAMSFASFAPAQAQSTSDLQAQINSLLATIASLQAQLGGSTTASVTFTRDLTIGSTGADVTALQTWLISKGYSIPAGATGYFGAQTQAALAAFQAANGISPAAGYFGPITRAKVASMTTTTTGTGTTTTGTSTTLSGGEADLTNYQLNNGNGIIHEGDTNVPVATAQFDVNGGDVNVQRVDLEFTANNSSKDVKPWKYIKTIYVYDGSKKLGSVDASSQSAWSDNSNNGNGDTSVDTYKISVTGLSDVIKDGSTANLTVSVDAQTTIDSDNQGQSFDVDVPDQGVRAVDAAGIQQYVGGQSDVVTMSTGSGQNGDIIVSLASDNPSAGILVAKSNNTSDTYQVLNFNIRNDDDADAMLDNFRIDVNSASTANLSALIQQAQLTLNGQTYTASIVTSAGYDSTYEGYLYFRNIDAKLPANTSLEGTLKVVLNAQSGNYNATGEALTFAVVTNTTNVDSEGVTTGDESDVSGGAIGNAQTLALNGITVTSGSTSANSYPNNTDTTKSYGTYSITFNVNAVKQDVYIASTTSSTKSATNVGVSFGVGGNSYTGTTTSSLSSTATKDTAGYYVVHVGSSEQFTLTVTLDPSASGQYEVDLGNINFNTTADAAPNTTFTADPTDASYRTAQIFIQN